MINKSSHILINPKYQKIMSTDPNPSQTVPTNVQESQNEHQLTRTVRQTLFIPQSSPKQNVSVIYQNASSQFMGSPQIRHTTQHQNIPQPSPINHPKKQIDIIDLDDQQSQHNEGIIDHELGPIQNQSPLLQIPTQIQNSVSNQIVNVNNMNVQKVQVEEGQICNKQQVIPIAENNIVQDLHIIVSPPQNQPNINLTIATSSPTQQNIDNQNNPQQSIRIQIQQQQHNHQIFNNHNNYQQIQTPKFQNANNPMQPQLMNQINQQQHQIQTPIFRSSQHNITNNIIIQSHVSFQNTQMIDQNQNNLYNTNNDNQTIRNQEINNQIQQINVQNNENKIIEIEERKQNVIDAQKQGENNNIVQSHNINISLSINNNQQINQKIVVSSNIVQKQVNESKQIQNIQIQKKDIEPINVNNNMCQINIGEQIPQISSQKQHEKQLAQQNIHIQVNNKNPQSVSIAIQMPMSQNCKQKITVNLEQQYQENEQQFQIHKKVDQIQKNNNPISDNTQTHQTQQKQSERAKIVQSQQINQIQKQKQASKQNPQKQKIDINKIKAELVQFLPSPLREQALALADDALIQLYLQIRGEEQKNAANNPPQNKDQINRTQENQQKGHLQQKQPQPKQQILQKQKQNQQMQTQNISKTQKEKQHSKKQSKKPQRAQQNRDRSPNQPIPNNKKSVQTTKKQTNVKRERKRVVTTVVQQIEYFDDSQTEQPSKYAIIQNGEPKRKTNVNKSQMQETLTQLSALVHSLDLTAFANQNA